MRSLIFLAIFPSLALARSSSTLDQTLNGLFGVTRYREASVSPDGRHVAWTIALKNKDFSESRKTEIRLDAGRRVSAGPGKAACEEHGLAWSPDSTRLAFLSDCANGKQLQVYVVSVNGGGAHKLTSLRGFLADPRWSPDGKQIAVLFTANAPRAAGPLEPATKDAGVVEEKFFEQRLSLIDVASGKVRELSPTDAYVYEYDWSPDSRQLVYTAAQGNGDNNWWIAELYAIAADSGEVRHLMKPDTQIAVPRWSPDGKRIALIAGLMSDEGSTGGDIYDLPASGVTDWSSVRNLTPGRKSSPSWIHWRQDGKLLFSETVDGSSAISLLNPMNGEAETLWRGDESIDAGADVVSVADDGRTSALIRSSWTRPPEVWSGMLGDWQPKTHANDGQHPDWGQSVKLHWTTDGAEVEGWLLYPAHFDAKRRYPMVVSVHGGPASARKPTWPSLGFDLSALAAEGFFVLFPNPRGSYGTGESFARGNVKDFGFGDLRDILAGVDAALKTAQIDKDRVGIGGWSYGGYMTMWAVTQTNRFHAAVAGAGLANWQSYYGENLIDQWMIPYFGATVYDDPSIYARSSPITYIKAVSTPTLVVVGDSDAECPAPQSYEFWHALKTRGVKTQLVVYPNEGHRFHDPAHTRDVLRRTIEWFTENLSGS